jgi:hypothetical protein
VAWPASAAGAAYTPPGNGVYAGLTGGTSIERYERMVGKHPAVFETYMTWNTPTAWLSNRASGFLARLALHLSTAAGYGQPGVISPLGIARGGSDRFLVALNRNLARSGRIVYVRIMAEMNGYWNPYAPFAASGAFRGAQNSPSAYVAAWRRTVVILRGGRVGAIDRRLRALGLPPLRTQLRRRAELAHPRIAFLWVPQDAGSPDIAANAPGAFWPGAQYVDWVGTDFYASYPNFDLLSRYYAAYSSKPFVLSEWALYGADDPGFVRALFAWIASHPRVRMVNYYQGFSRSGLPDLGHYPRSRVALRRALSSPRFVAYAPEYRLKHVRGRRHRRERPPLPPQPGAPPNPLRVCLPLLKLCLTL